MSAARNVGSGLVFTLIPARFEVIYAGLVGDRRPSCE